MPRAYRSRSVASIVASTVTALALAGCGGGSNLDMTHPPSIGQQNHNYTKSGYRSPNYHPYESPSHIYSLAGTTYVGGDVEPREKLRRAWIDRDIEFYVGASRDGVGVGRLANYDTDLRSTPRDGFYPFRIKPRVWIDEDLAFDDQHLEIYYALRGSIDILNDVLPPEFQIELAGWFDYEDGIPDREGDIAVSLLPSLLRDTFCSETAVACALSSVTGYTRNALLILPDDLDMSQYMFPRTLIIHELLHALGIQGHVDSIEFPDSIMGTSGDFFPNPGFTIHRIDREVLQIMYMSKRTDKYNDWDEWSDTTLHLVGRSVDEHVHFGVALFNGLPQPWARGTKPEMPLADNWRLGGRASWDGLLFGFSGPSPISGDVTLSVVLSQLDIPQDLMFRDIYFLNRFESDGPDRWFPTRNLDYEVEIGTNTFWHESDEGQIAGSFLGPKHEGMAGTIKRTDLVGAFGGKR